MLKQPPRFDFPSGQSAEAPIDIPTYQYGGNTNGNGPGFYIKWGVVFLLLVLSLLIGVLVAKTTGSLPDIQVLETYKPNESTQIFDRSGSLVANIHGDEDRVVVPLKDMSPYIKRALLAIEDTRFYEHNGIDPRGMLRAFVTNVNSDEHAQGGSTITQQLVKNLFLTPEKSYTRKLAEALLALRVEKYYSKDKILEMYLNQVYFGNQSYGIEKAARRYFKKPAKRLTIAESALLAGLLKAPEGLSPYIYPKAARKRQLEVLDKMVEYGYITAEQRKTASQQQLVLNSRKPRPSKHPYFVAYVITELEKRYGEDVVRRGGLRVYTTMDEAAQDAAEKALSKGITSLGFAGVKQGALVSIDVPTGEILAMVGGVDFEKNQFNAATQARRAVGSTFKPFVYLTALRLGKITTKTPIVDRPITYGNWSPHNWDGKYMGAMNIRKALMLSRNTTTVQVGMKVGIEEITRTCTAAGINPSHIDQNSSSILGSSGVSPLELLTGYSTLARGGIYIQPTAIKRVEDNRGHVVKIETSDPKRTIDQDFVAGIVDILIDAVEKGTGTAARIKGRVIAGKTGTTDEMRDIWFMGFTPDMVAGVWMGDPSNKPMHGVFGANAAQVWHDYADAYYQAHPIPTQEFFTASSDYAVRAGLVHLVDTAGLADAKKRLAAEHVSLVDQFDTQKKPTAKKAGPQAPPDSKKADPGYQPVSTPKSFSVTREQTPTASPAPSSPSNTEARPLE